MRNVPVAVAHAVLLGCTDEAEDPGVPKNWVSASEGKQCGHEEEGEGAHGAAFKNNYLLNNRSVIFFQFFNIIIKK